MKPSEAQHLEFSAAKSAWIAILLLHAGSLAIAIFGIFYQDHAVLKIVTVSAAVILPIASVLLKKYAGDRYSKGEAARRLFVLSDGWGKKLDSADYLLLSADTTSLPSFDPQSVGEYYSSTKPPGAARVAHITQESAFYSLKLSATSAKICLLIIAVPATVGLLLFNLVLQGTGMPFSLQQVTQVAGSLLAFTVSGEFIQLALSYQELASSCRLAVSECGKLAAQTSPEQASVYMVIGGYDNALAKAPPLPGLLQWLYRNRLSKSWKSFDNSSAVAPSGSPPAP